MGCGRLVGGDPWAGGAGRAGVSARLLMAGIWGVIERGGRPGARVGLHEQLNVIRPRPSGSSWVIDNPAAFLRGPGHQTGCRRRAGRRGRARGPALFCPAQPFSLVTPTAPGRNRGSCPLPARGAAGKGKGPKGRGGEERPAPGTAPGRSGARLSSANLARNRWNGGRKDGNREQEGGKEVTVGTRISRKRNH